VNPTRKVLVAIALFLAGAAIASWVMFLISQGLSRADQWSSVGGFIASVVLGASGLVIAWLALKQSRRETAIETSPSKPTSTGSVFHVKAKRDAYTAQDMTINQGDPKNGPDGANP